MELSDFSKQRFQLLQRLHSLLWKILGCGQGWQRQPVSLLFSYPSKKDEISSLETIGILFSNDPSPGVKNLKADLPFIFIHFLCKHKITEL